MDPKYAAQGVQTLLPNSENVFVGHMEHVVLPKDGLKVPGGQGSHDVPFGWEPAVQEHDEDPAVDSKPLGHDKHTLLDVAPIAGEYVFASHSEQDEFPNAVLNVPGIHAIHKDPFGWKPAAQEEHAEADADPNSEPKLSTHDKHTLLDVAPIVVEYVFTGHKVQVDALYVVE